MKLGFVVLAFLALVVQTWALVARDSIPTPDKDPWYQPPDGWKDAKPGAILRSRKVEIKTLVKDHIKEAWQLLYRTTYVSDGEPTVTATTVMIPHNADADKLVVFGVWVDANGPQCAPSYSWRNGLWADPVSATNVLDAVLYLQQGYIVTVPDKQGEKEGFASAFGEGHQTLDGIRATLNFDKLNFTKNAKVAGAGYSGGAFQLAWAAALRKKYAPELNMVGWGFGGTITNLTSFVEKNNKTPNAELIIAGLTGLYDSYDSVKKYLDRVLTKKGKKALQFSRENCQIPNTIKNLFKDVFSKDFSTEGENLLRGEEIQKVLKTLTLGVDPEYTPIDPILMGHAKSDETVPYESAHKTYEAWCKEGADIEFITYTSPLSGHDVTMVTSMVPNFMWVRDRLEGRPLPQKGCKERQNGEFLINVNALGEQFRDILGIAKGMLGDKIGPNDKYLNGKRDTLKKWKWVLN